MQTENDMKFIKHQKVTASLTDFSGNLSVFGAFQIVEDAITEFMGELKIDGPTAKKLYNAVWVYAKTKIKFLKDIVWNNECIVTCFISKISNVAINMDVGIQNAAGALCVYSRTELCALDAETGRIRKVSTVGVDDGFQTYEPICELTFTKIEAENLPVAEQIKVGFTNIDYVVHTNNKEYVRFMLNTYSVGEMAKSPIREMEVVFANQSYEGDVLTLHKGCCCDKDVFVIQKEDKVIVKCAISRGSEKA